jgi:prepilin-type N-terminal cleavage/methylation domain-containing protein
MRFNQDLGFSKNRVHRQGLTLVEIMIALTLVSIITLGVYQLTISSARTLFDTRAKLQVTRDVRVFTNELSRSGKSARQFYIYPGINSALTTAARVPGGASGDFLLLVAIQPAVSDQPDSDMHVSRLTAYIREVDEGEAIGPVVRYQRNYAIDDASRIYSANPLTPVTTVEAMATAMLNDEVNTDRREVLELSRGVADERLFINFRNRSVVVNGEILHGNNIRRLTNTYNFTVSPRG